MTTVSSRTTHAVSPFDVLTAPDHDQEAPPPATHSARPEPDHSRARGHARPSPPLARAARAAPTH